MAKRITMDCAGFSASAMAMHFSKFGAWLGTTVGTHKAAIMLHRYLPFFMAIERQWQSMPEYAILLKHFGAPGLRKVLLPIKWMQDVGLVAVDDRAKAEDSDQRRIVATLSKFKTGTAQRAIIDGYHDQLLAGQKEGKTTWRSVRFAMTPAAALLLHAGIQEVCPPDQNALDTYLHKTPGQRAAVSGFVGYLRDSHKVNITTLTPANDKAKKVKKQRLENELLLLLTKDDQGQAGRLRLLAVAMAYFHGVAQKAITDVVFKSVTPFAGGVNVNVNLKTYWLPSELHLKSAFLRSG